MVYYTVSAMRNRLSHWHQTSMTLTLFVPVTWCCCPLVALQPELHAACWSSVDLDLCYSEWVLFYWHQHSPSVPGAVWVGSSHSSWFQHSLVIAWMHLLFLAFSLTDREMQQHKHQQQQHGHVKVSAGLPQSNLLRFFQWHSEFICNVITVSWSYWQRHENYDGKIIIIKKNTVDPCRCSTCLTVYTDIAQHSQQESICHRGGAHSQGMLVACAGWHTQMNSQDLDISHDLSWCTSSQTAKNGQNNSIQQTKR